MCPAGPWPVSSFTAGGPQASSAAGGQSQRTLRMRVEGPDDERICSRQDFPHSGSDLFTFLPI